VAEDHLSPVTDTVGGYTDLAEAPSIEFPCETRELGLAEEHREQSLDKLIFVPNNECSSFENPVNA